MAWRARAHQSSACIVLLCAIVASIYPVVMALPNILVATAFLRWHRVPLAVANHSDTMESLHNDALAAASTAIVGCGHIRLPRHRPCWAVH